MRLNSKKRAPTQTAVYKNLAPWQRLAAACELYWFAREIIKARTRRTNHGISEAELEKKVREQI